MLAVFCLYISRLMQNFRIGSTGRAGTDYDYLKMFHSDSFASSTSLTASLQQ